MSDINPDTVKRWLEACESASSLTKDNGGPGFTQWELEFLESLRNQFDTRGRLSEKQASKLKDLYDKT